MTPPIAVSSIVVQVMSVTEAAIVMKTCARERRDVCMGGVHAPWRNEGPLQDPSRALTTASMKNMSVSGSGQSWTFFSSLICFFMSSHEKLWWSPCPWEEDPWAGGFAGAPIYSNWEQAEAGGEFQCRAVPGISTLMARVKPCGLVFRMTRGDDCGDWTRGGEHGACPGADLSSHDASGSLRHPRDARVISEYIAESLGRISFRLEQPGA